MVSLLLKKYGSRRQFGMLAELGGGAAAMPPVTGAWLNEESGALIIEETGRRGLLGSSQGIYRTGGRTRRLCQTYGPRDKPGRRGHRMGW